MKNKYTIVLVVLGIFVSNSIVFGQQVVDPPARQLSTVPSDSTTSKSRVIQTEKISTDVSGVGRESETNRAPVVSSRKPGRPVGTAINSKKNDDETKKKGGNVETTWKIEEGLSSPGTKPEDIRAAPAVPQTTGADVSLKVDDIDDESKDSAADGDSSFN